jgi:hypothetical protein
LRGVSKDGREHRRFRPILRGSPLRGEHLEDDGGVFLQSHPFSASFTTL